MEKPKKNKIIFFIHSVGLGVVLSLIVEPVEKAFARKMWFS